MKLSAIETRSAADAEGRHRARLQEQRESQEMGGLSASSMIVDGVASRPSSELNAMLIGGGGVMTAQVGIEGGAAHTQEPPSQQGDDGGGAVGRRSSAGPLA
jgi:hypothetical protein